MRIGFLSMKAGTAAGGLATYELYLLRSLAAIDQVNQYHVFCVHPVDPRAFGINQSNFTFHLLQPKSRLIAMAWSAPRAMARVKVDLFHASFLPPLWFPRPFLFTAHGPEMFIDPTFFPTAIRLQLVPLTKYGYRFAAEIGCASEATRNYLLEHFPRTRERSRVIYNGCDDQFRRLDRDAARGTVKDRFGVDGPYVLAVGRVEPRKNPIRLLEAFALFAKATGGGVRLVIAGNNTWSASEAQDAIRRLGVEHLVTRLGFVEYKDLPSLYAAAEMFVFPSLWEGFGLPLIEAMRCGAPTITSNTSCLPEVAGGASLLVDPLSPENIADAMVRLHSDAALRDRLRELGYVRGAEFSWERAARETLEAYRDIWQRRRASRAGS